MTGHFTRLRVLTLLRTGTGVARLAYPDTVIPGVAAGPPSTRGRKVVRVLGVRQVAQAVLTGGLRPPAYSGWAPRSTSLTPPA